jgi:transcriptional regulator with XRE-family HTH domain
MQANNTEQNPTKMSHGELIRRYRYTRGMTQLQMADRFGMTQPSISKVSAERLDIPSFALWKILEEALEINLSEVLRIVLPISEKPQKDEEKEKS